MLEPLNAKNVLIPLLKLSMEMDQVVQPHLLLVNQASLLIVLYTKLQLVLPGYVILVETVRFYLKMKNLVKTPQLNLPKNVKNGNMLLILIVVLIGNVKPVSPPTLS